MQTAISSPVSREQYHIVPAWGALVLCLAVAGACDEPMSPFTPDLTFVARTVGQAPLPAAIIQHEAYEVLLLTDTLHLALSGESQRVTIHRDTPAGGPPRVDTTRRAERFVIRGDSIRFVQYCPPNAICLGPPEGIFSEDRRQLILQLWPSGPEVTFERVSP